MWKRAKMAGIKKTVTQLCVFRMIWWSHKRNFSHVYGAREVFTWTHKSLAPCLMKYMEARRHLITKSGGTIQVILQSPPITLRFLWFNRLRVRWKCLSQKHSCCDFSLPTLPLRLRFKRFFFPAISVKLKWFCVEERLVETEESQWRFAFFISLCWLLIHLIKMLSLKFYNF